MDVFQWISLIFGGCALFLSIYSVFRGLNAISAVGGFFGKAVKFGFIGVLFVILPLILFVVGEIFGIVAKYNHQFLALAGISLSIAGVFWFFCTKELEAFAESMSPKAKKK